jgi:hypothetical protein
MVVACRPSTFSDYWGKSDVQFPELSLMSSTRQEFAVEFAFKAARLPLIQPAFAEINYLPLGSTRARSARNFDFHLSTQYLTAISCHLVNQYLTFMATLYSIFYPTFNILI